MHRLRQEEEEESLRRRPCLSARWQPGQVLRLLSLPLAQPGLKSAGFWEGFAIATGSLEKLNRNSSIVVPTLLATDWRGLLIQGIQRRGQMTIRIETDGVVVVLYFMA
ncbi:unnamed protein product, partial [Laminaria digitata]